MTIGNVSGMAVQGTGGGLQQGMNAQTDAVSKNIQKQIMDAQKQLQELSSNNDMNMEERMKKRQEIQQQISDLNMQLRQHQTELKKQQREEKRAAENNSDSEGKAGEQNAGLSTAGIKAVISSETSMKQAKVQNGVVAKMEGKAGVLEAESLTARELDLEGGAGAISINSGKEAELAETKNRAKEAEASGMKSLKEANRKVREEAGMGETDPETEKEEERAEQIEKDRTGEDKTSGEPGKYVDVRL